MDKSLPTNLKDKTGISDLKIVEYKKIGSMLVKPGLTLYSFNSKSGEIAKVKIEKSVAWSASGDPIKTNRVYHHPDCLYFYALNDKNAVKKVKNALKRAGWIKVSTKE